MWIEISVVEPVVYECKHEWGATELTGLHLVFLENISQLQVSL